MSKKVKIAVVISTFYPDISKNLLKGLEIGLVEKKYISLSQIEVFEVPGAFEIPLVCQKLAQTKKYTALITLGAIIKGQTDHYDFVAKECAEGIMRVQLDTGIPIIFEVLMVRKAEHALARSSLSNVKKNKGYQAAYITSDLLRELEKISKSV